MLIVCRFASYHLYFVDSLFDSNMKFLIGTGGNSVYVNLSLPVVAPGSLVQGEIYLNILTPTNFSGVSLKVSGKERVYWVEDRTKNEPYTERVFRDGQYHTVHGTRSVVVQVPVSGVRKVFKVEIGIMNGGILMQGQYTVPFSFVLPSGIPGSFSLAGTHRGHPYNCSVAYRVKALVRVPGLFKSNLRYAAPLTVIQPPPSFSTSIVASASADVVKWCCINKGRAELSFHCAKDSFTPGEPVQIVASGVNNSTAQLARLTIKLRRNLQLVSNCGRTLTIEETITERIYPGLEPHTSIQNSLMGLEVPHNAPQQCVGSSIRCIYSVRVSGKVKWGRDVVCSAPAFIYQRVFAIEAPQYSPTWQPQMMQAVVVSIAPSVVLVPAPLKIDEYPDSHSMRPSAPVAKGQ